MITHLLLGGRPACGAKGKRIEVEGRWVYADACSFVSKADCADCLTAGVRRLQHRHRELGRPPVLLDEIPERRTA